MDRQDLENRLRSDAERLRGSCPPRVRQRVSSRIRTGEGRPSRRLAGLPVLAGAFCVLGAVCVSAWLFWQTAGVDQPASRTAALNALPVVAKSDRVLAAREAALEDEWQRLERDLRILRDHLTATFNKNPSS